MAKYINRFIALDNETGGIPCKGDCKGKQATIDVALTETALVVVENETLEIIDKQSWLVKPYDDNLIYGKGAEKVSGISKQMCIDKGIELEQMYENIKKVLVDNKVGSNKPIIIMQNADFDLPFMENLFMIFGDKFTSYIDRVEDTVIWSRRKWPLEGKHNLGTIASRCGVDHVQAHRALPDTIITAQVWIHFMKSLRGSIAGEIKEEVKFRRGFKI